MHALHRSTLFAALLASLAAAIGRTHVQTSLPAPEAAGFEHVVVVMMENRSFDHFLGWMPGANGKQSGLTYLDSKGAAQSVAALTEG